MKKILMLVVIMSQPAIAEYHDCEVLGQFAEQMMVVRQKEIPKEGIAKIVAGYDNILMTDMFQEAWKRPLVQDIEKEARNFKNEYLVDCYRAL